MLLQHTLQYLNDETMTLSQVLATRGVLVTINPSSTPPPSSDEGSKTKRSRTLSSKVKDNRQQQKEKALQQEKMTELKACKVVAKERKKRIEVAGAGELYKKILENQKVSVIFYIPHLHKSYKCDGLIITCDVNNFILLHFVI